MTKLKNISLASLVVAGVAASLVIHHKFQVKFHEGEILLQQQEAQLAALTAEHQRLSNRIAQADGTPPENHTAELAKLRHEAEVLKKPTNHPGRQWEKSQASRPASNPEPHPPEYYEQLYQLAGTKPTEARDLGMAFQSYAMDHQNQSPSNLDQLTPYLAKENRSLSGSNQFEIIYQGSLDTLQGIPWGSVAVVREQQPWPGPDGKMMRLYGMIGGIGQIVGSDDNFVSWEARHVIPAPTVGQAGQ